MIFDLFKNRYTTALLILFSGNVAPFPPPTTDYLSDNSGNFLIDNSLDELVDN